MLKKRKSLKAMPKPLKKNTLQKLSNKPFPLSLEVSPKSTKTSTPTKKFNRKGSNKVKTVSKPKISEENFSDSDSSVDSSKIGKITANMRKLVLSSLSTFKARANEYIMQNDTFEREVENVHSEFQQVENEIEGILQETLQSKQEISKIKKIKTDPSSKMEEDEEKDIKDKILSAIKDESSIFSLDLKERLGFLRKEIEDLKGIINQSEEQHRANTLENIELKMKAHRMQDTLETEVIEFDSEQRLVTCKSCCVF